VPAIVHLPGQTGQSPSLGIFTHVTDNTATFLDVAGVTPPSQPAPPLINTLTGVDQNKGKVVYDNRYVYPLTGKSLLPQLHGTTMAEAHTDAFGDEACGRAYLRSADGRWKALWTEPPLGPRGWSLAALRHHERSRQDHGRLGAEPFGDPEPHRPVEHLYEQRGRRSTVASARVLLRTWRCGMDSRSRCWASRCSRRRSR
jgi:hypothetical protein